MSDYSSSRIQAVKFLDSLTFDDLITVNCYSSKKRTKLVREFKVLFPLGFFLHTNSILKEKLGSEFKLTKKIIKHLQKESAGKYTFNYFDSSFKDTEDRFVLPDDIDDVALFIAAFAENGIDVHESYILNMIRLEEKQGGPYSTWYIDKKNAKKSWLDVDPTVNAHIVYALATLDIRVKNTERYLRECIEQKKIGSPYYPDDMMFYYNISKYTKLTGDRTTRKLVSDAVGQIDTAKLSNLGKIYYLIAKINIGEKDSIDNKLISKVLKLQKSDGGLEDYPLCMDYTFRGKPTYTSNRAVITAIFLELVLLLEEERREEEHPFIKAVKKEVFSEIEKSKKLSKIILRTFPKQKEYKPLGLPLLVMNDFVEKPDKEQLKILELTMKTLFFGWLAFTYIDNYIDEREFSEEIPAIIFLMQLHTKYAEELICLFPWLRKEIEKSWRGINENYIDEATKLRFRFSGGLKKSNKLSNKVSLYSGKPLPKRFSHRYVEERMSGYIYLLSVLPKMLRKEKSLRLNQRDNSEIETVQRVIKAIVVLDQLDDDSHDWNDDMNNGILTLVTWHLLSNSKTKKDFEKTYLESTTEFIYSSCVDQYLLAKKAIAKLINRPTGLEYLLDKTRARIEKAKGEIDKSRRIAKEFRA